MDIYPVLNPMTKIRQNDDGCYLSSQIHRIKVQLDDEQAKALTFFDGKKTLGEILQYFAPSSRRNLSFFLIQLQSYLYLDCYTRPNPIDPVALPENPHPHLQEVHLDITSLCNLQCKHCYQTPYLRENLAGNELTTDEWLNVLDQLKELNVDRVNISGGEPLLRTDLSAIIDGIFQRGIKLSSIFTNGTLSLVQLIDHFKDLPYPIDYSVSLDGPTEESHDEIRGHGAFKAAIKNIKCLVDLVENERFQRYSFDINTCVFTSNIDLLEKMYIFIKELRVPRWRISLPRDEGAFVYNRERLKVENKKAFAVYRSLIETYLHDFDTLGPENIPYLQIESIFRTSMLTRKELVIFTPKSSCCEYKRYSLAIKPNGDVLGCTSFRSKVMGNVREKPLHDIWYNKHNQYIKTMPIGDITDCADCKLLQYCGAGCRSNVIDKTGSITAKDELACEVYEFFAKEVLPIIDRYGIKYVTA